LQRQQDSGATWSVEGAARVRGSLESTADRI
jgi:hypothetical protein